MQQFVIIGLGSFGRRMVEELSLTDVEVLIIDRNKERIEKYKSKATSAYITDVINVETLKKIIPENVDAVIIDLGDQLEVSILVTNYLNKMGLKRIVVRAENDEHGEILSIVGATQVVFPNREASKRIAPLLVSPSLFNYLPISSGMVIAEAPLPARYRGVTVMDANLRREYEINIIAVRKSDKEEYGFIAPEYRFAAEDILLIAGKEEKVAHFTGIVTVDKKKSLAALFKRFF